MSYRITDVGTVCKSTADGSSIHTPHVNVDSGNVGGFTQVITVTPTVTIGIYHANDNVGGKSELASAVRTAAGTAILQGVFLMDKANQKVALDLLFFDADPAAATLTDNSAPVFTTPDLAKIIARVPIVAGDYVTIGGKAFAHKTGINLPVKAAGTSLWLAISTTATPTYASTSDLVFKIGLVQD